MFISPQFLTKLATDNLSATTYRVALYLPKLIQNGQVNFDNKQKVATALKMSRASVRRAITELEQRFVIIPVEDEPQHYYCNPYFIWDGSFLTAEYESSYKRWNNMIKPRILASLKTPDK